MRHVAIAAKAVGKSFKWIHQKKKKIWADHVYYDCISFMNPICLFFFLCCLRSLRSWKNARHIGMQQLNPYELERLSFSVNICSSFLAHTSQVRTTTTTTTNADCLDADTCSIFTAFSCLNSHMHITYDTICSWLAQWNHPFSQYIPFITRTQWRKSDFV